MALPIAGLAWAVGRIARLRERWAERLRERARERAAQARRARAERVLAVTAEGLAYAGEGESRTIRWDEVESVEYHESNVFYDPDPSTWWLVGARRADGTCPIVSVPDDPQEMTDRLLAACAMHLPDFDEHAHRKAAEAGVFRVPELATVTYWRRSDRRVSVIYWYHRKDSPAGAERPG